MKLVWWNKSTSDESIINLQYSTIKTPVPDFIYTDLKKVSAEANEYKPQPSELIKHLSNKHKVPSEMIYLTSGLDEAINLFSRIYSKKVYVFTPCFISYDVAKEYGGDVVQIPSLFDSEFKVDTTTKDDASLIFVTNPNNPAGFITKEKVIELVKNNSRAVVFVDEAYAEFSNLSVVDQVVNHKNMVVGRSFSKAYGMAGNRIGYIIASPDIVNKLSSTNQWANVSYLSVGAALSALKNETYFEKIRNDIIQRRNSIQDCSGKLGYKVIPSFINAMLIKFPNESTAYEFVNFLKDHQVIVSHGNGNSNIGLDLSYVRISIGTEKQMSYLSTLLQKFSDANFRKGLLST